MRVHLASFGLSGDGHKTRKTTLYYSVLARAGGGRILPIHFPISDFMLLFFPRVFQFLSSRERNWQKQQENPNDLGKKTITTIEGWGGGGRAGVVAGNSGTIIVIKCPKIYKLYIFCGDNGYGKIFFS